MKIGVFGPGYFRGREYGNYSHVERCIDEIEGISFIITGGGVGAEQLAQKYAALKGIEHDVVPPNIKLHGLDNAFIYRNQEILKIVDFALVLWDGRDTKVHRLMADAVDLQKQVLLRHVE